MTARRTPHRFALVVSIAVAASGCAPQRPLAGAPCDGTACAPGFTCCEGSCIAEGEACLGPCLAPSSGGDDERFMPFVPDSIWTYRVTNTSTRQFQSIKKLRLGREESLAPWGEGAAHRLCREDRSGDDGVESGSIRWEQDTGESAVWRRNLRIDASGPTKDELPLPNAIRIDESADRLCVGARYDADWTERIVDPRTCAAHTPADPSACDGEDVEDFAVIEAWTVDAIDVPIDVVGVGVVPCLQVTRTSTTVDPATTAEPAEVTTFWFARGIGKVREVNPLDESEELLSFAIPGGLSGGVDVGEPIPECGLDWWPGF